MRLAIDTATDRASVAVQDAGGNRVERALLGSRRHAAGLLPLIVEVLDAAGGGLEQVTALAVSDGPGSFTGLRVGATVAKALVQARGLPLWTAPSLMVRARGVARDGSTVLAVSNALRGELYAAAYRFEGSAVRELLPPSVYRPDELAARLPPPDVLVGEAPPAAIARLEGWAAARVIDATEGAPHAGALLELMDLPGGAVRIESVRDWAPIYGRPAEAQARWEAAHGRPLPDSVGSPG